ncbi:nucleotidyltransferase domain-containing protein [Bifidobacterium parmae]|uniref:Nucleotidyltransferase n=1 Tax=Bifidobacterium parmae TaxID=361854 RepID=A0A2N5J4T2_9BIFI|nr:nucleotidyltransferase domain-containing protein [Bifidobacterium parmae]PLS29225.1 nucleotidyltransferase [Bifidobacterium parmae]
MKSIAELREERRRLHVTQGAVAKAMGTTQSALSRAEREGNPTQDFLQRYEQALDALASPLTPITASLTGMDVPNIASIRAAVARLTERYGITDMYVFGSTARGEARPDSDVDLLYRLDPEAPRSLLTIARLRDELTDMLHHPVSLTSYDSLLRNAKRSRSSKRFLDHITPDLIKVA